MALWQWLSSWETVLPLWPTPEYHTVPQTFHSNFLHLLISASSDYKDGIAYQCSKSKWTEEALRVLKSAEVTMVLKRVPLSYSEALGIDWRIFKKHPVSQDLVRHILQRHSLAYESGSLIGSETRQLRGGSQFSFYMMYWRGAIMDIMYYSCLHKFRQTLFSLHTRRKNL